MDQKTTDPWHDGEAPTRAGTRAPNGRRTSVLLREFMCKNTAPRVSLGALRDALGDRGFGVLLLVFALPNLVPLNIPLLNLVLGLPVVLLAAQLTYGRHEPWFPDWLMNRSFSRARFNSVLLRTLPALERIERLLRPRLTFILSWSGERLIGAAILFLAVVLTLPIPLGNWLPAFAIAIIGLAIAEKDGVAVLVGLAIGVVSVFIAGAVVIGLAQAAVLVFSTVSH